MVTRVDKKPIIYNTCLIRCLRPSIVTNRKDNIRRVLSLTVGLNVPDLNPRQIIDDYEDIEYGFRMFGIDDPAYEFLDYNNDAQDDECIRIARMCLERKKSMRQALRSQALMDQICTVQSNIFAGVDKCYFGTEAVYQLFTRCINGDVFKKLVVPNYATWCTDTAKKILLYQSTYCFLHPMAVRDMAAGIATDCDYRLWHAWDMFKKMETIAIRIGSRKNMLAHAYYSGINKKGFEPSKKSEEDFLLPLTGYCEVMDNVTCHMLMGLRYYNIGGLMCVLSHDDCINLASMAQCYFRTALYFTRSNGYEPRTLDRALSLIRDIASHCCALIDSGRNFSHIIRSMHIMSQGEFNDSFEEEVGADLGWRARSQNYINEAIQLDAMGPTFHKRATDLAVDKIDKLNTCFIYHVFVGDEMLVDDLRSKVSNMTSKVLPADKDEWGNFMQFVKAYTLARFMHVNKRKPLCGGDIKLLNEPWAERCVGGSFTMPPRSQWGKVWIQGEFKYTEFADTWNLEAQDVSYVVKDSEGIIAGKYISDDKIHSELIMAMTHGNILDTLTGSTPRSTRERICSKGPVKEVVITSAPKAENAKPSWKKRVTFAADCEFRKMQAEFDRNCRRIMSFVRGPSLGVDQCILEKQFADIAEASATGSSGAICSHDISAWSESMDRERKFEFEQLLIGMFDKPDMINIKDDWGKINAVINKQGCKDVIRIDNGSFQGFDGSSSTILHSMILIYCIDTARRQNIMSNEVKTNMATLIDDCIALMLGLNKHAEAEAFWTHLKATYLKLGFEVDDLKSIFSTIKAIYLSRRFLLGGEVPADFKVFIKAHSSYEDPLRCTLDVPGDIFGAMRGSCDANGEPWYIYFCACLSVLAEIAHNHNCVMGFPPSAAAVFALAPTVENGWGFPSIVSWATNDVTDKRVHFNAMFEALAIHSCQPVGFTRGVETFNRHTGRALMAIKSQAWRLVSYSNVFTNPFEAIRDGPLKPDMLRRNAIQEILEEIAVAEPWKSLLGWNTSSTTTRVREMLIQSGPLHAPTLAALVNCMPDNYRLSLVGKAVGSESVLNMLKGAKRTILKRRVYKCAQAYFEYSRAIYDSSHDEFTCGDYACLDHIARSTLEREEFYTANGVHMTDHTFPDPVATFTTAARTTESVMSPNMSGLRIWDKSKQTAHRTSQLISDKGLYVPRRSGRVWEVTCEYAKGWDTVSQRIAMGLAILARAEADGHRVDGLLIYFIKSWNELSNITPNDTHLIAIHGSIKRLDANPGSATHPIITNRNILRGFNNRFKSALDAIPRESERTSGSAAHLHDFLAHETSMLCVTSLIFSALQYLGTIDYTLSYNMATRPCCVVSESAERMKTHLVSNMIQIEIMDGADNYGLLQACPSLAKDIAIPTMKSSWVRMINALITRDIMAVEELRKEAYDIPMEALMAKLEEDEVMYSPSVILAAEPAERSSYVPGEAHRVAIAPTPEAARATGDSYTCSVRTIGSKFTRALTVSQPDNVMTATVIRSVVWSRLKTTNAQTLASVLYQDPDADLQVLERCGRPDFWRGIIVEVNKMKKRGALSEVTMSAFRALGIPDVHIRASNDPAEVIQSVSSYFGAHLRKVTCIIADQITSLAGRKEEDYAKPFAERIVTNNPSKMNAKIRREHMKALIDSNVAAYKKRLADLRNDTITHRGDSRSLDKKARSVDLVCRLYTYLATHVSESGDATFSPADLNDFVVKAGEHVAERLKIPKCEKIENVYTLQDAINNMKSIEEHFASHDKLSESGWDAYSGELGCKLAYETIMMDTKMIMGTKYAISAAEIAPRVHKRVIITEAGTPLIGDQPPGPGVAEEADPDEGDGLIDPFALDLGDEDEFGFNPFMAVSSGLPIPYWQALYSLVLNGYYTPVDVNNKLGTCMDNIMKPSVVREAHLEDFDDQTIRAAFPRIDGDYVMCGVAFDPSWLDRDEADAYTTDEMNKAAFGFLF